MRAAVYNSAIPNFILSTALKTVNRAPRRTFILPLAAFVALFSGISHAADWTAPEQQLARKIVAVTGPGAVAVTIENRSTLSHRDSEIIRNGLHTELLALGLRFVKAEQSAATVDISLSENEASYVWVAEIHQGAGESSVVMISTPRPEGSTASHDSVPLSLRKVPLWTQARPVLDIAVLEEGASPTHIAVLDADYVSLYRWQNAKWELEQALPVTHVRPWPRDLRGRLIPARDHLLDVYLPGRFCQSTSTTPLALECRESDDPWPLIAGSFNGGMSAFPSASLASGATTIIPQTRAFFAPARNFFTGAVTPAIGKFTIAPKFYSAAVLVREKYTLWLFAAVDGQVHMVDGVSDQAARLGWGSDIASLKTACGAGWQVLATSQGESLDSVRAYEMPDRDPIAVTAPVDLSGPVTALWTEARGDSAIAVTRNRETGNYEAYRLAMVCSQ